MIFFSDFILSQKPWSYCRLDEPIGYHLYHDSSGNRNHLFSDGYADVAANRQIVDFTGDPFIGGIRPSHQSLSINSFDHSIKSTALKFQVPLFKSDTWIYRRKEKIQNDLAIHTLWADLIIDTTVPASYTILEDWLPPLVASNGHKASLDHVYTNDEFSHTTALTGNRSSISLSAINQLYSYNETFFILGSVSLIGVTGVHYHYDGTYLGHSYKLMLVTQCLEGTRLVDQILWSKTIVTIDPINDPVDASLNGGSHRFTIGIINPTTYSMTIAVSIDGAPAVSNTIALDGHLSFASFDHSIYSRIAIMNDTIFSNLSVFFNKAYPSDDWLAASQRALTRSYTPPIAKDWSILSKTPIIEKQPGSLLNALNAILFLGVNHRFISYLTPISGDLTLRIEPSIPGIGVGQTIKINQNHQSPFSGCWFVDKVETSFLLKLSPALDTIYPSTITYNAANYERDCRFSNKVSLIRAQTKTLHHFSTGDMVTIHHLTETNQQQSWVVTAVDGDGFTVRADNISTSYSFTDDCIIKQTPIGGGSWTKTFSNNEIGFGYNQIEAYKRNILIDDRHDYYSEIRLAEIDNTSPSEKLYIPKDIRNTINKEKDRNDSKAVGDCHRFYWFVPSKQNTVSHTSIIVFGEILDWFNNEWCSVALVSLSKNKDQDIGFNYAFLYPSWSIEKDTGFLICRSFKSHVSDGMIQIGEDGVIVSSSGYGDTGEHVYPINTPYISFTP